MGDSKSEMEKIQQNLEHFLDKELDSYLRSDEEDIQENSWDEIDADGSPEPESRSRSFVHQQCWREMHSDRKERTVSRDRKFSEMKNKKKKKKQAYEEKKKKTGFRKFLNFLGVIIILFGIFWFVMVSFIYGKMEYSRSEELAKGSLKDGSVINVLLIGSDARSQEEQGRSDAMILLSVSKKTDTVQMTSLLRDMYVDIPGHDGNRLNTAYSYGGPELLLQTVSQNLDIDVNRYVVVNFNTFASLVEAVGGVEMELSNEEVQWVNAYLNEFNLLRNMPLETDYLDTSLSGSVHLNGPQALAYSRNRFIGSDFGRTERQRKVLSAVMAKLPGAVLKNPAGVINGLFSELTTNLSKGEFLQMSLMAGKLLSYDIVQGSIPIEGSYSNATIRGMDVLKVDFKQNQEYIRRNIYGE